MGRGVQSSTLNLVATDGEMIGEADLLQGLWTEEQYLRLTDWSNRPLEFTDGSLEVLPIPTKQHQAILGLLYRIFHMYIQPLGGAVFLSPLRIELREGKFREPDLMLALDVNDPRLQNAYFLGVDLVLEIVSPDSVVRDTITKRNDYAEALIPEYWIVNPIDESITVLRLEGTEYVEHGLFRRGESASSLLVRGLAVDVSEVLDAL